MEDVIATPWVRSRSSRTRSRPAPTIDSELVRVSTPSWLLSLGSRPVSRILCSSRFRQAEVVLEQGVLGAVAAAGHARTALDAPGAGGARATEIRIGHRLARFLLAVLTEEDADRSRDEGVADAHVVGHLLEDAVGVGERRVRDDAEHAGGLVVMGHQLGTPVGDV